MFNVALSRVEFSNAHSHAFQYAMVGKTEVTSNANRADDFWSWRRAMYQIALGISPDELEKVATRLYQDMLNAGYGGVAEFHYLHHDQNGNAYSNPAEMGERLVTAAKAAGIAITLVPVYYNQGNFGVESDPNQRRFISKNVDEYFRLVEATQKAVKLYDQARLGVGVHSLRAANKEDVIQIFKYFGPDVPKHLHISEQIKEVNDCIAATGLRPVEYLFDFMSKASVQIDSSYHLVHATHSNDKELELIANSGANVVLCPTTEGNLGDGFFSIEKFVALDGSFSIGSDSHISIDPLEELRWIDYGARLRLQKRNPLCGLGSKPYTSSARLLYEKTQTAGRRALGLKPEETLPGGLKVDTSLPAFAGKSGDEILATLIYGGSRYLRND